MSAAPPGVCDELLSLSQVLMPTHPQQATALWRIAAGLAHPATASDAATLADGTLALASDAAGPAGAFGVAIAGVPADARVNAAIVASCTVLDFVLAQICIDLRSKAQLAELVATTLVRHGTATLCGDPAPERVH